MRYFTGLVGRLKNFILLMVGAHLLLIMTGLMVVPKDSMNLQKSTLMDIEHLQDAYMGHYGSGAEFAESFVSDCYGLPSEMPYWIAIDWEETWSNLEYDYTESNGYIFCIHW